MFFGLNVFPMDGLTVNTSMRYNDNFYAGFSPSERDTEGQGDVYKLPSFSLVDVHLSFKLKLMGTACVLGAHVLGALKHQYIDKHDNTFKRMVS